MSNMSDLDIRIKDLCESCGDKNNCDRCTIVIKIDGKEIKVNGKTKNIVEP